MSHLLTAVALLTAHTGATAAAAIAAALAAYTAPDAAWLLPAIALLCASRQRARCGGALDLHNKPTTTAAKRGLDEAHVALARFGCCCAAALASLLLASRAGAGDWGFLRVYAAWLSAADTHPNCGAWWYLLVEAFPPQVPRRTSLCHFTRPPYTLAALR